MCISPPFYLLTVISNLIPMVFVAYELFKIIYHNYDNYPYISVR